MHGELAGKVAVVTGAAQGIGRSIAEHLQARGARLVLVDVNQEGLAATAAELRGEECPAVHALVADLSDAHACLSLGERVRAHEESVDILVNNAGIELELAFDAVTAEAFDRVIAVNLRAPLLVAQALAPLFPRDGGAIVNISSIHADHAFENAIPYACSKAGLRALTRNLALELAPRKVRVNAVCPGYIDTPMWEQWLRATPDAETVAKSVTALHPLGRRGMPADVAAAVAYLAGPEAAWITGTFLVVDGGLTVRAHP